MVLQAQILDSLMRENSVIITGSKGGGKTTLADKVVDLSGKQIGGCISRRCEGGYQLEHIPSRTSRLYCCSMPEPLDDPDAKKLTGLYWFSPRAFLWAQSMIAEDIRQGIRIILIDEIGYAELQKQGFYDTIRPDRRSMEVSYLLVIRDKLLKPSLDFFMLHHCTILTVRKHYE